MVDQPLGPQLSNFTLYPYSNRAVSVSRLIRQNGAPSVTTRADIGTWLLDTANQDMYFLSGYVDGSPQWQSVNPSSILEGDGNPNTEGVTSGPGGIYRQLDAASNSLVLWVNYTGASGNWANLSAAGGYDPNFTTGTVTTSGSTPTTIVTLPLTSNSSMAVFGRITGWASGSSQSIGGTVTVSAKNVSGTVSVVDQADIVVDQDSPLASATFGSAVSGSNLLIQVTGVAATTINWSASVNFTIAP